MWYFALLPIVALQLPPVQDSILLESIPITAHDLDRFPPRFVADTNYKLCKQHEAYYQEHHDFFIRDREEYGSIIREYRHRARIWYHIDIAQYWGRRYPEDAIRHLKEVRFLLGTPNYLSGRTPPP